MSIIEEYDIKALCLDIDGTLYSKNQMNVRLIKTVFPNLKLGLSFNRVRKSYRKTQENEAPKTNDREGFLEKQAKLYLNKKTPSKQEIENVINQIENQFYKVWAKSFLDIKAFPNMQKTLQKAKNRELKIALLSDFPIANKVDTLNLTNIVDLAISSEESGYLKPSKMPFEKMIKIININPKNCIYFGDSYNKDIVGAKSLGMKTIYISKNKNYKKYEKADYICKDWYEVESLLF